MRERELINAFSFPSSGVQCGIIDRHIGRWIFSWPTFVYIPAATCYIGSLFSPCEYFPPIRVTFPTFRHHNIIYLLGSLGLGFAIFLAILDSRSSCTRSRTFSMSNEQPSIQWLSYSTSWTGHISASTDNVYQNEYKFAHSIFSYPESWKLSALARPPLLVLTSPAPYS